MSVIHRLASRVLADSVEGSVYRLAPAERSHGVVAPYTTGEILFGADLTGAVSERYQAGDRISARPADGMPAPAADLLFLVRADGQLAAVTQSGSPVPQDGDIAVCLGPAVSRVG